MLAGPGRPADPAAVAALAGLPAGADLGRPARRRAQRARPSPSTIPNRASLPAITGEIEFDKVRFRYRPDAPEALRGVSLAIAAGRDARHRRPVRLRQVDPDQARPAALRARAGPGAGRRRRSRARRSGLAAPADRRGAAGEHPVQPHGAREYRAGRSDPADGGGASPPPSSPARTSSSSSSRTATTRSSRSAAPICRAASASASRSPGR